MIAGWLPYQGSLKIDGREIRDMGMGTTRNYVSVMEQKSAFFSGTIRDNIAVGEPVDITPFVHIACLEEDLASLPEGPGYTDSRRWNASVRGTAAAGSAGAYPGAGKPDPCAGRSVCFTG